MFEEILNLSSNFTSIVRSSAKKHEITLPQALLLFYVSINGTSMSELASKLGLDPSTVTRNIEKLEKRNFLYRQRATQDTRVINVYKSSQGHTISENIEKQTNQILSHEIKNKTSIRELIQEINWKLEKKHI
tara:strand:+ start:1000 stop:1395 length:396 start_codon:yes stop_codon:yes gene_type:complete